MLSALLISQSCWAIMLVMPACLVLALESKASSVTNELWGLGFQLPDLQCPHPRQKRVDGSYDLPSSMNPGEICKDHHKFCPTWYEGRWNPGTQSCARRQLPRPLHLGETGYRGVK